MVSEQRGVQQNMAPMWLLSFDDAKKRVRHPIETVVANFDAGIAAGAVINLMMRRRPL
jgi:hypothetical protein